MLPPALVSCAAFQCYYGAVSCMTRTGEEATEEGSYRTRMRTAGQRGAEVAGAGEQ